MTKEQPIETAIIPLVTKAESFVVKDDKTMNQANEMLSQLNSELDRITADREKITKPLNESLKEIRARYKPAETKLTTGIAFLRGMISTFRTNQKRLADDQAKKIEDRIGEGKGKLKFETASNKIAAIEKPSGSVITESGMTKFRTDKKCELEDITKVPVEFLVADMVAIRKAMKEGIEVPGIRYFTEETPVNLR